MASKNSFEEISTVNKEHSICMNCRKTVNATGIIDVMEFSEEKVELKTNMGDLVIKGKNLNISKLDTDSGALELTGEMNTLEYVIKKGSRFCKKLFG